MKMPTLRNLIMASKIDNSLQFVSVNLQWNNQDQTICRYRKKPASEAKARVHTLLTDLLRTTKYKLCTVYFTPEAQNAATQNAWDTTTNNVIWAADLFVPIAAITEDIKLLGLEEYIDYSETTSPATLRAENIYLGEEVSSVNSFTTGRTVQQTTTKFDDNSTIGSKDSTQQATESENDKDTSPKRHSTNDKVSTNTRCKLEKQTK
jgi:hypothetical protein